MHVDDGCSRAAAIELQKTHARAEGVEARGVPVLIPGLPLVWPPPDSEQQRLRYNVCGQRRRFDVQGDGTVPRIGDHFIYGRGCSGISGAVDDLNAQTFD